MKTFCAVLTLLLAIFFFGCAERPEAKKRAAMSASLLDGKKFEGTITAIGKEKSDTDVIVFTGGRFVSSAFVAYGFVSAPYFAERRADGVIRFSVEVINLNPSEGTLRWQGQIKQGTLTAFLGWIKKGGEVVEYSVTATQK